MRGTRLRRLLSLVLAMALVLGAVVIPGAAPAKAVETPKYRNVMYYGDWSIYTGQQYFYPSKIDGSDITHLNFAFMDVDKQGNLVLCDEHADFQATTLPECSGLTYGDPYAGVIGAMFMLRREYPNMKIGISVGGWTRSGDFPDMSNNATARANFVKNICKFVRYTGFDFVDIDWEYPGADRDPDAKGNGVQIDKGCKGLGGETDGKNFTLLMQDLRAELDRIGAEDGKHYELSCAMSASPSFMQWIDYTAVSQACDFINMMTYDLNGAWNGYTGHQTPLYTNESYDHETQIDGMFSVDACIRYLEEHYPDMDFSKVVVGVTAYTRGWAGVQKGTGKDPNAPGLYATATPSSVKNESDDVMAGCFGYKSLQKLISQYNLKEYWDDTAKANYYYSEDTGYFFTCDTPRSIQEKANYVKEKGLGGFICWMSSNDEKMEISHAMKTALFGEDPIPAQPIILQSADVSVTVTKTDSTTYTITIKNNATAVETNTALKDAENNGKSITYPKLYIETNNGATVNAGSEAGSVTMQGSTVVVDLASVYAAKALKAGASHTFTLRITNPDTEISSITMTQRIKGTDPQNYEFGEQLVYGSEAAQKYNLTLTSEGAIASLTGGGSYESGAVASISAPSLSGYNFLGWYDGNTRIATGNSTTYTVTGHKTLTAKYEKIQTVTTYTLTLKSEGATATLTGAGSYESGKTAAISAPNVSGYNFLGWYDGNTRLSTSRSYNYTVTGNKTLTAKYEQIQTVTKYTLNLTSEGANATLTGAGSYEQGTVVNYSASDVSGYKFLGWYNVGGKNPVNVNKSGTLTMNGNISLVAKYEKEEVKNTYTVSAASAMQANDGAAAPGGITLSKTTVTEGDSVTATAKAAAGYDFVGWFAAAAQGTAYTGTPLSTNLSYTFKPTADTKLAAVYKVSEPVAPEDVNVTVVGTNFTITVDGKTSAVQRTKATRKLPVGTVVTVTCTDDTFVNWQSEFGMILSKQPSYTFTVLAPATYTAANKDTEQDAGLVEFVSDYDQVMACFTYTAEDEVEFPDGPVKIGFIFDGWDKTQAEIQQLIASGEKHIVVSPKYHRDASNVCDLDVYVDGVKSSDLSKTGVPYGENVSLTAPAVAGKQFKCWATDPNGSNALGYTNTYFYKVLSNASIYAVYVNEGETVTRKPTVMISPMSVVDGQQRVTASIIRSVPDGYTMVEHGVLFNRDGSIKNPTSDSFVIGGTSVTKGQINGDALLGVDVPTVSITNENLNTTVFMRGYLVVRNQAGETEYYYTDIISGTFNNLLQGIEEPPITEPTDPIETDPIETDPIETDPIETDPIETDPIETDPIETDPIETDPIETDPPETDPIETDPPETDPKPTDPDDSFLPAHMVTGYWHNFDNGLASAPLKLSAVPDYYDMICIAFTESTATPGEATFKLDPDLCTKLGYSEEEFIQDIKDIKAQGRHVIISVGGAEGKIQINSDTAADTFARTMIEIIDKYGFEGVDIDLEGPAVSGTAYVARALRQLHDHYGENFIITMAPEVAYMEKEDGQYMKLCMEIKDILTICYPQFYNSGNYEDAGTGQWGTMMQPETADFIACLITRMVQRGLRPDQIGIGLPSCTGAGGHYTELNVVENAVRAFVTGGKTENYQVPFANPGLRSMMTWSINWDASQDYKWAKFMVDLMGRVDTMEPTTPTDPTDPDDPDPTDPVDPSTAVDYVDGTNYNVGDIVKYNGKLYKCIRGGNAWTPPTQLGWFWEEYAG